jgi:hypothetical protein
VARCKQLHLVHFAWLSLHAEHREAISTAMFAVLKTICMPLCSPDDAAAAAAAAATLLTLSSLIPDSAYHWKP